MEALTEKIVKVVDATQPASLEVKNMSSLSARDVSAIGQELQAELGKRLRLVSGSEAKAQIVVTLSEGARGYVWVAQVQSGTSEQTVMLSVPRGDQTRSGPVPVIARNIVWKQAEPFLDFDQRILFGGLTTNTVVLEREGVVPYYGSGQSGWIVPFSDASQPRKVFHSSRDVRGKIIGNNGTGMQAIVSGSLCVHSTDWFCGDPPGGLWPFPNGIGAPYAPTRNYFTDLSLGPGTAKIDQPPFFSIAFFQLDHGTWWIATELDGKARLYQGGSKASATFSGWGDDIATIQTSCSREWEVLVTGTGDWTQADHIQIYEIRDSQAMAVGQPLEFPGPILALWAANDLKTARVVSLNLQTGMYEGSIITVTCGE